MEILKYIRNLDENYHVFPGNGYKFSLLNIKRHVSVSLGTCARAVRPAPRCKQHHQCPPRTCRTTLRPGFSPQILSERGKTPNPRSTLCSQHQQCFDETDPTPDDDTQNLSRGRSSDSNCYPSFAAAAAEDRSKEESPSRASQLTARFQCDWIVFWEAERNGISTVA